MHRVTSHDYRKMGSLWYLRGCGCCPTLKFPKSTQQYLHKLKFDFVSNIREADEVFILYLFMKGAYIFACKGSKGQRNNTRLEQR